MSSYNKNKRQTVIISNNTKQNISDLNNDVIIQFPSEIFYKNPTNIELMNINIKLDVTLFGYTNNYFKVTVEDESFDIVVEFNPTIKNDNDLALAIQNALNLENYPNDIQFNVFSTNVEIVMTNVEIERDDSTTIFSIAATKPFSANFGHKDSIGPIIGVGNSEYKNVLNIEGHAVNSITSYNFIYSVNNSKSTLSYPDYDDANCKMILYDSDNNIIDNIDNPTNDTTISINSNSIQYYSNISEILSIIETEMNLYSNSFTPAAEFILTYDYQTNKVTIENTTGAKFGISFDFISDLNLETSGSLHRILGFEQKKYLGFKSITSIKPSFSYHNIFPEDYVLLCSSLTNDNIDINIIGIGAGDNIKNNQVLFAIPLSEVNSFAPQQLSNYRISINASSYARKYKSEEYLIKGSDEISFYLRLLSGRHIKGSSQWSALLSFGFDD